MIDKREEFFNVEETESDSEERLNHRHKRYTYSAPPEDGGEEGEPYQPPPQPIQPLAQPTFAQSVAQFTLPPQNLFASNQPSMPSSFNFLQQTTLPSTSMPNLSFAVPSSTAPSATSVSTPFTFPSTSVSTPFTFPSTSVSTPFVFPSSNPFTFPSTSVSTPFTFPFTLRNESLDEGEHEDNDGLEREEGGFNFENYKRKEEEDKHEKENPKQRRYQV